MLIMLRETDKKSAENSTLGSQMAFHFFLKGSLKLRNPRFTHRVG